MEDLKCSKCGKASIYTLKDGTVVCRRCGHREPVTEEGGVQQR